MQNSLNQQDKRGSVSEKLPELIKLCNSIAQKESRRLELFEEAQKLAVEVIVILFQKKKICTSNDFACFECPDGTKCGIPLQYIEYVIRCLEERGNIREIQVNKMCAWEWRVWE